MVTDWSGAILTVTHLASLAFSGSITYFAYRAYRRTASISMRSLTIGFAIISLGLVVGGGSDWFTGLDFEGSIVLQSLFMMIGFAFLTYSIFVDESDHGM